MTNSDVCRLGILTKDLNAAHWLLFDLSQLGYSDQQIKEEMLKRFEVLPWENHAGNSEDLSTTPTEDSSSRRDEQPHEEASQTGIEG